jgi:excisionase family DNA binding protein
LPALEHSDWYEPLPVLVYGTLRRGMANHDRFCFDVLEVIPARTPGRLYALPYGFPAMVPAGDGRVFGEILVFPDPSPPSAASTTWRAFDRTARGTTTASSSRRTPSTAASLCGPGATSTPRLRSKKWGAQSCCRMGSGHRGRTLGRTRARDDRLTGLIGFRLLLSVLVCVRMSSPAGHEGFMTTEERWVGVGEVAAHLGVGKDSIYRWVEKKGLPAHRVGRLLRFRLSEVDEWVQQGGGNDKSAVEAPTKSKRSSRGGSDRHERQSAASRRSGPDRSALQ